MGSPNAYWNVLSSLGTIFRVDGYLWVFQDWDDKNEMLQIGIYHHMICLPCSKTEYRIACTCPCWRCCNDCIHRCVTQNYSPSINLLPILAPTPTPAAVLLHTTPFNDTHIFLCISSTGHYKSGKRSIVTLERNGQWHLAFAITAGFTSQVSDGPPLIVPEVDHEAADRENTLLPFLQGQFIPFDQTSQCCCGVTSSIVNPACKVVKLAVVYGLMMRFNVEIELVPCLSCRHAHCQLGADLGCFGLFNWNNTMIFSHELLNGFTNLYTASETPFSAFCLTVRCTYMDHDLKNSFCSDKTFVRVWFPFTHLQTLDSGMSCPTCGPSPKVVIADGISLGIHHSKMSALVCPPMQVTDASECVETISSYKACGLPAIIQGDLHTLVVKLLELTATELPSEFPDTSQLFEKYQLVANLIQLSISNGHSSPHFKAHQNLIRQIAALDIVLQLVPYDAIELLEQVAQSQTTPSWLQYLCPTFGAVIQSHNDTRTPLPIQLREITGWLVNQHMGDCNKFYKTYSKNNLTGGILVLWCTHTICLGFHYIPVAEGQNDVFSAIYTQFAVAPEVIVYDFACQLAPYCLVHEAQHFQHTHFLIDEIHAHDHTHCGQACFASNAMHFND
ncbi:hypothetical protein JAAARDRAFT_132449 [Jaapia argillacea MUCL 33604]|uniref:HMG domain-containing protein n=1 Tax=Jaapia argillacea MUCL 33604 TaxID=933084 RepID=A0A067Q1H5_9AGAM|nr:hypothetical protein JAAARDRAFT_132449 [Jaapia argillacea MUCL 33604]